MRRRAGEPELHVGTDRVSAASDHSVASRLPRYPRGAVRILCGLGTVSVGPLGFATGPFLAHGQSLTYSWYLTKSNPRLVTFAPKTAAAGYVVTCQPIDYHGVLPT
jgi:hypothetical protein